MITVPVGFASPDDEDLSSTSVCESVDDFDCAQNSSKRSRMACLSSAKMDGRKIVKGGVEGGGPEGLDCFCVVDFVLLEWCERLSALGLGAILTGCEGTNTFPVYRSFCCGGG